MMKLDNLVNFGRSILVAVGALLAGFACTGDGGGYRKGPGVDPLEGPQDVTWEGYFSGWVSAGDESRYSEALLTADGLVRVLVGNPTDAFDARDSTQFLGRLEIAGDGASGAGVLVGQGCTQDAGNRFCGHATPAEISISVATSRRLAGQIRISTLSGEEVWDLEMSWPTITYLQQATLPFVAGLYGEELAEFAHFADTVISVDGDGRLHFQSASSGCVGNGEMSPYADGHRNVYSVSLTIEICDAVHSALNGPYEGLATRSVDDQNWSGESTWGDWLVVWLVSPVCSENECQALTMWGRHI